MLLALHRRASRSSAIIHSACFHSVPQFPTMSEFLWRVLRIRTGGLRRGYVKGVELQLSLPTILHGISDWEKVSVSSLSLQDQTVFLCVLDRASSWYLNKGRPTRWHLLYYLLLNIFQMLIHPSSGACDYLLCCCVGCNDSGFI